MTAPPAVVLDYRFLEPIHPDTAAGRRGVERWDVRVLTEIDGSHLEIGSAQVLVLNLPVGSDVGDLVDRAAGTWRDGASVPDTTDQSGDDHDPTLSHVLVLDRVWLQPAHRGRGLGPVVAGAIIERLGRGCHLAACFPAPFEGVPQSADDRARSVAALGAIWARVGFRPIGGGVWMIDLLTVDVHRHLEASLAASASASA